MVFLSTSLQAHVIVTCRLVNLLTGFLYHVVVAVQMLQSDLVNQQKTASAVREEGERIIASQTSVEASSSTRDALRQLDDSLVLLESRLGQRLDDLTAALSEVRLAVRLIVIDVVG